MQSRSHFSAEQAGRKRCQIKDGRSKEQRRLPHTTFDWKTTSSHLKTYRGLGSFLLPRVCSALLSARRWWERCWEDDASGEEILVTGAEEKRQRVVRGGGKGAYIKQQNSETDNAFLEKRNVRERDQRLGNYGTAKYVIKVTGGPAASCNNTHPVDPTKTQGMSIPPPSSNVCRNFQAPIPHYHKRQEFCGLLRPEIQEKCL